MTPEEKAAENLAAAESLATARKSVAAIEIFRRNCYASLASAIDSAGGIEKIDPKDRTRFVLYGVPLFDALKIVNAIDALSVVIDVQDRRIIEANCKMTELQTVNPALKPTFDRLRSILAIP
jgi:beta-xylosidase